MTTTRTAATGRKVRAGTVWEAMRTQPLRIAFSPWPLRAFAYLTSGAVVGAFTLVWLPLALLAGMGVLTPLAMQPLVALERRRAVTRLPASAFDPYKLAADQVEAMYVGRGNRSRQLVGQKHRLHRCGGLVREHQIIERDDRA